MLLIAIVTGACSLVLFWGWWEDRPLTVSGERIRESLGPPVMGEAGKEQMRVGLDELDWSARTPDDPLYGTFSIGRYGDSYPADAPAEDIEGRFSAHSSTSPHRQ